MARLHIPEPTWIALKTEFCSGAGTLRELAEKYSIKLKSAESRARREGWSKVLAAKLAELNAASDQAIEIVARHHAMELPAKAQEFVCKVSAQAHGIADNLAKLSAVPARTVSECSERASVLERVSKIGRATYNLDDEGGRKCLVNIHVLSMGIEAMTCTDEEAAEYEKSQRGETINVEVTT